MSRFADSCPAPPDFAVDLAALAALVEAVVATAALATTPQDVRFHAEGDVWTHTVMVAEAMAALPAWRALPADERALLFAAAALHDVGKPACTRREDDGRISSRGHSARGELAVRAALWQAGAPFDAREHVCSLIRLHQVPFFAVDRGDAERVTLRASLVTRNDWLALVAEADARGRRCEAPGEPQRIIDNVAIYRELAAELGVLSAPRRFADEHTRFTWLRDPGRHPDVAVHDDRAAEVLLLSGLPASGKDSWLRAHRPDLAVVSLDELRDELDVDAADAQGAVIAAAKEAAREHLRAGRPFAWNATNLSPRLRGQLVDLCAGYRAGIHIVYCEVAAAEQQRRNRARARPVPAAAIGRMLERWVVPGPDEGHRVTYVVEDRSEPGWPPPIAVALPAR